MLVVVTTYLVEFSRFNKCKDKAGKSVLQMDFHPINAPLPACRGCVEGVFDFKRGYQVFYPFGDGRVAKKIVSSHLINKTISD